MKIKILVVANALLCLVNFYAQVTKKCPILTKINRFSVSNCLDWFNSNRLVVNASKSSTMIITTLYNITNICKPFINDATLEHNTSSKLLGIMIDQTLKWDVLKVRLQKINPKGYATRERFLQRIRQNTPNLRKIARWSFQRNRYSSTCTAKSLFAVNRGFNYGSDRHFGVYY